MPVNILLADDHVIIMDGLRLLISNLLPDAQITVVKDMNALISQLQHTETQLVICDINMPGGNHPGIVKKIKSVQPKTKLLILSGYNASLYQARYLQAGADAYLNKNALPAEIETVIMQLLEGKEQHNQLAPDVSPLRTLSNRELEVAQLLIDGNGILEISNLLDLHVNTVSTYKARIFEKTNIGSIPELVALFQTESN